MATNMLTAFTFLCLFTVCVHAANKVQFTETSLPGDGHVHFKLNFPENIGNCEVNTIRLETFFISPKLFDYYNREYNVTGAKGTLEDKLPLFKYGEYHIRPVALCEDGTSLAGRKIFINYNAKSQSNEVSQPKENLVDGTVTKPVISYWEIDGDRLKFEILYPTQFQAKSKTNNVNEVWIRTWKGPYYTNYKIETPELNGKAKGEIKLSPSVDPFWVEVVAIDSKTDERLTGPQTLIGTELPPSKSRMSISFEIEPENGEENISINKFQNGEWKLVVKETLNANTGYEYKYECGEHGDYVAKIWHEDSKHHVSVTTVHAFACP